MEATRLRRDETKGDCKVLGGLMEEPTHKTTISAIA
jgi:hypothetical protein